jgi:hypothetical protein
MRISRRPRVPTPTAGVWVRRGAERHVRVRQLLVGDPAEHEIVHDLRHALTDLQRIQVQLHRLARVLLLLQQLDEVQRVLHVRVEKSHFGTRGRQLDPAAQIVLDATAQTLPHVAQERARRSRSAGSGVSGGRLRVRP